MMVNNMVTSLILCSLTAGSVVVRAGRSIQVFDRHAGHDGRRAKTAIDAIAPTRRGTSHPAIIRQVDLTDDKTAAASARQRDRRPRIRHGLRVARQED